MTKTTWMLLACLPLFQSCSPQHPVPPPVAIPKQFPHQTRAYQPIQNLPSLHWWTQFKDEHLNRLMARGLACNLDIHIAVDNLQKARGELKEVKLSWLPTMKTFAGYSTNPALGVPGGFVGVWPYYVVNIVQLLEQQKRAQFQVEYYQAMVEGARLAVIGQIASAYFTLIAEKEQLHLFQRLDKHLLRLVEFNRQDLKIGLKNDIDVADAKVQESLVSSEIKIVEQNIVSSQNALRYLLDQDPGKVPSQDHFSRLNLLRFKPGSLPVSVLRNRPDVQMAEIEAKAAHVDISIAYSEFFPSLQLDQFEGKVHLPHGNLASLTDAYMNWSVMPSTLGRISSSKAAYRASVDAYRRVIQRVFRDVDNDFSAHQQLGKYYLALQKAEQEYRYQFNLQTRNLKYGLISSKQLLENEIRLDYLALGTNQAKLEFALTLVLLYQDLAGGYQPGH